MASNSCYSIVSNLHTTVKSPPVFDGVESEFFHKLPQSLCLELIEIYYQFRLQMSTLVFAFGEFEFLCSDPRVRGDSKA
jgi:hypothetical protein